MNIYLPIFTFVGILVLLIYVLRDFKKQKTNHILERIVKYSFFVYLIIVAHLTIGFFNFPLVHRPVIIQPIPFFFLKAWKVANEMGTWFLLNSIKVSFYNLIMLMPLGVYLVVIFGKPLKISTYITFGTSFLIESLQLTFSYIGILDGRSFDVDDLILNTLGGVLGSMIGLILVKKTKVSLMFKNLRHKKISTKKIS